MTRRYEPVPEYITTKGAVVAESQLYRDARETNVRVIRVDAIHGLHGSRSHPDDRDIEYTVVLVDGDRPKRKRPPGTTMTAKRITSSVFRLLTGDELAAARARIAELRRKVVLDGESR